MIDTFKAYFVIHGNYLSSHLLNMMGYPQEKEEAYFLMNILK
jgi:hypothetical protein